MSSSTRRALAAAAAAAAACVALGACGTPAAVKPAATPLPGFKRDIQEARNAVAQTERAAQADGGTNVNLP